MQIRTTILRTTILLLSLSLASCSGCSLAIFGIRRGPVTLLAYNVENLFDDVHNGDEYREYDPASGEWNTELFHIKMQNIAEVLRAAGGADVVALEEVENAHAVETLNESYLKGLGYRALTAEAGKTSVTVAVLTRLPVTGFRMHHLAAGGKEPLRDIMEVHLDCRGEPLVVFVNHWKSKLGGAEATEFDRRAAAGLIGRRIRALADEEPRCAIVVAGDLNESWDEYERTGEGYETALLPDSAQVPATAGNRSIFVASRPAAARLEARRVVLYSPWAEGGSGGSYFYGGGWETIDHTLLGARLFDGEGLEYRSFSVFQPDFLTDHEGRPLGWNSDRASGYSDHLPILLTLEVVS